MSPNRVAALVLACALALGACQGTGEGSAPPPGPLATNATSAPLLPTHVASLPTFTPDTYHQLLGQLRGTPVIVNIWASWCPPCVAEAPLLARAASTYGSKIQFVGVDILDDRDGASRFLREHGLNYPSVFDPSGAIRDDLGVVGQPITAFYDADGSLVSAPWNPWKAELTTQALHTGIERLLA